MGKSLIIALALIDIAKHCGQAVDCKASESHNNLSLYMYAVFAARVSAIITYPSSLHTHCDGNLLNFRSRPVRCHVIIKL
jgi:hypothetical protein